MEKLHKDINNIEDLKSVIEFYGGHFEKEGSGYKTRCIFHNEKTSSLVIKDKGQGAFFKCYGCGESGDIINIIMKKEGLSYIESVKKAYEILGKTFDEYLVSNDNDKLTKLKNKFKSYLPNKLDNSYSFNRLHLYENKEGIPVIARPIYRSSDPSKKKEARTYKIIDQDTWYDFGTTSRLGPYEVVPYNYQKVIKAIENNNNIYFVEGEKDADNLNKLGFTATTICDKTKDEKVWNKYRIQFQNAKIVFIGDTGRAGEEFKKLIYDNLKDIVKSFKIVTLPGLENLGDNKDVSDWLESGKTKDDLLNSVKEAKDIKWSIFWKDVNIKENKDGSKSITPKKTIDNFKLILERANTEVYVNEITKIIEVKTNTFNNKTLDTLMIEIQSLCTKIGFKCNKTDVRDFVETIAQEKSINPFKIWVDKLPKWDGKSRLQEYYDLFTVTEGFDNNLKELLFRKWLLSFLGTIYDPNYKAYGLLVLKGDQGIGKGECFKRLVPIKEDWVFLAEGKFKGDRDNIQILTSNLIVELSEFARSAKAVDEIKGFVTADVDKLSLKYDKYATTSKRNTVYFATINDGEFLIDDENRRFWVIDLESINWEGINNFDYIQLWAELKEIYLTNPVVNGQPCYHLAPNERKSLQGSNRQFNYEGKIATELRKIFDFNSSVRIWLNGSEIAELGELKESSTAITRELKKMGEETSQRKSFKDIPRGRYNTCGLPKKWKGYIEPQWKERLVTNLTLVENNNDVENENNFSNKEMTELEKENRQLKKLILELKTDLRKSLEEIDRLKEENLNWEALFVCKEKEAN